MFETAIGKLVFLGTASVFAALGLLWYSRRVRADDELQRRLGQLRNDADEVLAGYRSADETDNSISALLAESGLGWSVGMFVSRIAMVALLGLLFGLAIGSGALGVVFALVGAAAVWVVVRAAGARRLAHCDEQMPQALEIMSLAMRAGHPLPKALELAAQETPAPLCHELRRACDELALGRPIGQVMEAFGSNLPGCEAVNTFVVAVLVLQETGGNLISVLDRIVDNARARASYKARLRALTAEGRQSAKLLGMLPGAFAVLAMASDKSYANMLLHDSGGRMILFLAGGLWLAGIVWTRRLIRPMA